MPQNPRSFICDNRKEYKKIKYKDIWGSVIKYCIDGEELPNKFENLYVVKKGGIVKREEWPPFGIRNI